MLNVSFPASTLLYLRRHFTVVINRKAIILILLALQELRADKKLIKLMRTLVEITEILYSSYAKRTSQAVLRSHNITFVHGKLCTKLFHTPKTMTRQKMFGCYFHALTCHAPILYCIICLRSMKAEMQKQMFGECKAITKPTSKPHCHRHLLCVQEQFRSMCTSSSLKPQESEITKLACTLGTKSHIVIPQEWLHNTPHQYQAHLERMSDFLLSCPGSWYFTTTTPNVPLPLYCTQ